MDLYSAGHRRGVVCAPHFATVEAGREILAEGGNAVEAMVAMAASIAAVYPHMNHLGGDGFWLIREPPGRVRAIMAAGPAGMQVKPELYRDYETMPTRGPLAALTVPGAVGGWLLALEAAKANGGRLPLDVLLTTATAQARDGYAVTRSQARLTREQLAGLKDVPGFAAAFLVDGKPPEVGARLKQEALAETLAQLAHAGLDDFYRGDVGNEIAADLERIGSPLTRHDLERYEAKIAEPLRVTLPSGTLYNTGAPTQGAVSLMILALFAQLNVKEPEGFDHIHGLVEATKRALRMRDRVVTDPNYLPHSLDRVLEDRFIAGEAMKIDRQEGRALAGRGRRGRHHLDGRGRHLRPRRVLHPIALLGIRLRLRAAGDRRLDAEPRREFFARSGRAQLSHARQAAVPYAEPGARRPQRRPRHGLWLHGRRRPAADPKRRVHAPCRLQGTARRRRSTARAGCSAAPGARRRRRSV